MRALLPVVLVLAAACRIETAASGRPPGPPTPADSLARVEQDSAVHAEVRTSLRLYYERVAAGDERALRRSFWPGATVATRRAAPGERRARLRVESIEQFTRRGADGSAPATRLRSRMLHAHVSGYGELADAWVVSESGPAGSAAGPAAAARGIDAFHLVREGGEWRIAALAVTDEVPGRRLDEPRRPARRAAGGPATPGAAGPRSAPAGPPVP